MSVDIELESVSPTREWLQGLIDIHLYNLPCVFERMFNTFELARQCRAAGYRAIVLKNHFYPTIEGAYLASKEVPGIEVYGSVVLNWQVGGLNPFAVDASILLGAKIIFLGNMHATTSSPHGLRSTKPFHSGYGMGLAASDSFWVKRSPMRWMAAPPTNVIDLETGEVLPAVHDIIELIAEAGIVPATCHISKRECFSVVDAAREAGVKNTVVTHVEITPGKDPELFWEIEELKKITAMGAILEHVAHNYLSQMDSLEKLVEVIKEIGADKCVLSSNSGFSGTMHPIESMRLFIWYLRRRGISEKEIELMTKKIPAKLLGIE